MSTLPKYTPMYGGGQVPNPSNVIQVSGVPPSNLTEDRLGTLAVDNSGMAIYGLASKSGGVNSWIQLGSGSPDVSSLTPSTGSVVTPTSGNVNLFGTTNQITCTGSGSTLTLSIPNTFIAPGSITASDGFTVTQGTVDISSQYIMNIGVSDFASTVNLCTGSGTNVLSLGSATPGSYTTLAGGLYIDVVCPSIVQYSRTGGSDLSYQFNIESGPVWTTGMDISAANSYVIAASTTLGTSNAASWSTTGDLTNTGSITLSSAGSKLNIHATTSANDSIGTATLNAGTVVVSTTAVTANSKIFLSVATPVNPGYIAAPTVLINPGVGFTINSSSITDASTVNYLIIN